MVTIGDTNMEKNVRWVNFCKWFGQMRELFRMSLPPPGQGIREFPEEIRRTVEAYCVGARED